MKDINLNAVAMKVGNIIMGDLKNVKERFAEGEMWENRARMPLNSSPKMEILIVPMGICQAIGKERRKTDYPTVPVLTKIWSDLISSW